MRPLFTFLSIFLLSSLAALAQSTGKISGIVKDEGGKGVPAATISLMEAASSSLVKTAVSDKDGKYEFVNIKGGNYLISVSSVGFAKTSSPSFLFSSDKPFDVPSITLIANATSLAGVTVQSARPFIETKLDKTIVNVDASPSNAGATALDVLEKSPGVIVGSDGSISLRGKQGVIVMMDGKPTYLSAADLVNMLKNMPASSLDQIEIMTNPSAKYDASGNSGIINIKTKKGRAPGFNGSVMIGLTTSIFRTMGTTYFLPKSQNSFTFNYRKGKVNFFGNYNPNVFRGRNSQSLYRNFYDEQTGALTGSLDQQVNFKFGNNNHTLKLGADFFADKKNTFGIVASGFQFMGHPTPVTIATSSNAAGQVRSTMISNADNDISFKNFTGNINWRHQFDTTGKELTADLDYVTYSNLTDMILSTTPYDGRGLAGTPLLLQGHLPSHINIYSFKSDYVKPYKNGRFEAGVKTSFVKNDNLVDYQNWVGEKWHNDNRSNHFIYEENINAAYVNANRQLKKWTIQGGLRVENTIAKGRQVTTNKDFDRKNTSLFPSAFLSYDATKNYKITASYSRRITRPNYQNLNPFIFFLDSLTFQRGNPLLKPQYTNNMELTQSLMGKYIVTLAYNNTTDVISQMIQQEDIPNSDVKKTFNTYDNVAKLNNISLSITAPIKLAKWWTGNFFSTVYNNHYTGFYNNNPLDVSATSFTANLTNTFTLGKGFTTELSGFYRYRSIEQLAILEPFYSMSLAAQKQVLQGKGTVRLNIRDPFGWQKFSGLTRYENIDMRFNSRPDLRQVTATFTYRFGKSTAQNQPRRRTLGSQEEQNRVGQGQ